MHQENYFFSSKKVSCYFNADFSHLEELVTKNNTVLIADENVIVHHANKFIGWKTIVIKSGEESKQQATIDYLINELINLKADRETFIVGIGGGVVTDMAGYVASIYMRGIKFGFVPTTILAMADASIGGKNGIDVGVYKNMVGTINHPQFLLYDYSFLQSLPQEEWINGFAEIIKHACIKDKKLFENLEKNSLEYYQASATSINELIQANVAIKCSIVSKDELETGERKLLNFGHTIGHAIENIYTIPHGNAVSIGMVAACKISEAMNKFLSSGKERIISLLKKYHLPVAIPVDESRREAVWKVLLMDKKRSGDTLNIILLNAIGEAKISPVSLPQLKYLLNEYL